MAAGSLTIDLDAIARNWTALDAASASTVETAAVVKADGYGLGAAPVAKRLAHEGARTFFVALAEEGVALRAALGPGPRIFVFSGYMAGDAALIRDADLTPLLNSSDQVARFLSDLPGHACGLQLDSGMNRLGLEPVDLPQLVLTVPRLAPKLVISHLACADEPQHAQNATQLAAFLTMSTLFPGIPKSLAATGGIGLGAGYHFDMTRPGVGLYGGAPFAEASPVVQLDLPVIQTRDVLPAEIVGYGASWTAPRLTRVATVSAGYADGLTRHIAAGTHIYAGATACKIIGRISMDLITVDVTDLDNVPDSLSILGDHQGIDTLAEAAGTIGYEILTSLGHRYQRHYKGRS